MTYAIVLSSSLLAVVLVVALVREIRRRRALQLLSSQILKRWRDPHAKDLDEPCPVGGPDDDAARLPGAGRHTPGGDGP